MNIDARFTPSFQRLFPSVDLSRCTGVKEKGSLTGKIGGRNNASEFYGNRYTTVSSGDNCVSIAIASPPLFSFFPVFFSSLFPVFLLFPPFLFFPLFLDGFPRKMQTSSAVYRFSFAENSSHFLHYLANGQLLEIYGHSKISLNRALINRVKERKREKERLRRASPW